MTRALFLSRARLSSGPAVSLAADKACPLLTDIPNGNGMSATRKSRSLHFGRDDKQRGVGSGEKSRSLHFASLRSG
jgi:hypothetical protein